MTQIHWANPISGSFINASDWGGGAVPGASDDAILDAVGSGRYTVTASTSQTVDGIDLAANATLSIAGGTFTAANGTDSGVNAGAISVAPGAALVVSGSFNNTGSVSLGGGHGTLLEIGAAGATFTGGGTVGLSDNYSNTIAGGTTGSQTLTNVDNTISGAGHIGTSGANNLVLINQAGGLIDATGPDDSLYLQSTAPIVNAGLIESTTHSFNAALFISNSTVDGAGGTIFSGANSYLVLLNSAVDGGVLSTASGGLIDINGSSVTVDGVFANAGRVNVEGRLTFDGNTTLTGGGSIAINLTTSIVEGTTGNNVLTNVDNTITGFGSLGRGRLTLVNEAAGVIDGINVSEPVGMVLDTGANTVFNFGLIEGTGPGGLTIRSTAIDSSTGGVILAGDGSHVGLQGADLIGGTLESTGNGSIKTYRGGINQLDGTASAVDNQANIVVQNGTALTIQGDIVNTGRLELISSGATTTLTIGAAGATLSGGARVYLDSGDGNVIVGASSAATLTNVDNVIIGTGQLGGGSMTLINDAKGVVIGDLSTALTLDTGANTIANAGLIESRGVGEVVIQSAVANSGLLKANGGLVVVNGAVSGAGEGLIAAGTLDFTSSFNQQVVFDGASGALELAQSQSYTGTVTGFSTTGKTLLDLGDIGFVSSTEATFSGTASGGVLTVTDGTHTTRIALRGDYLASTFTASSDGHGGTIVVDPAAPSAHRFIAAAAGLGAGGGGSVSVAHDGIRVHPPMLARPGTMVA
jgi:hypothetical protein